ncbi:hypothetical protein Tco_0865179 [Tanacetum coccineum]
MVYVVNSVLASGVDIILEEDFVCFALQEMEIHPLMLLIQTLSMIMQTILLTLHNPSTNHTYVNYVGTAVIMIKDYRNERIDIHYRRECEIKIDELKAEFNKMSIEINKMTKEKELRQREQERTMPLSEIISQLPSSIVITISPPVLPIEDPEDSLIIWNEELRTILEKESDEVNKSSVEDLVPIPSESEDTSDSDSECDLPFCDNPVTFSNPLFDSNEDFTSSDDESLSDEDVPEDKNIESKDSYVSNLDEPALLVTPLSDFNEDECFDPGGKINEIDAFLDMDISTDIKNGYHDSEGDIIYLESLFINDTMTRRT